MRRWLLNLLPVGDSQVSVDMTAQAEFQVFLVNPAQQAHAWQAERTDAEAAREP